MSTTNAIRVIAKKLSHRTAATMLYICLRVGVCCVHAMHQQLQLKIDRNPKSTYFIISMASVVQTAWRPLKCQRTAIQDKNGTELYLFKLSIPVIFIV